MSYFRTNTDEPSEPLTRASLQEAMDNIRRQEHERALENGRRMLAFWESVPIHLRRHPLVAEMSAIVESGQPIHPTVYEALRREWDRLIQDS